MRKSYKYNSSWSFAIVIFLLILMTPIQGLSKKSKQPRPYQILTKAISKYEKVRNGHYIIQQASTSIYVADTTKNIIEGTYSSKEIGTRNFPLIQQTTTHLESGNWLIEKIRQDTVSTLSPESEEWDYYLMTNRDRAKFLLTNHGLTPFTHPYYFLSRLSPFLSFEKHEHTTNWIIKSGPYKIWISREDTLIHRIDYHGSRRYKFYRRIDILHQDFNRPEYDDLDLYRFNPTDLGKTNVTQDQTSLPSYFDPIRLGDPLLLPPLPTTRGDTVSLLDFKGEVLLLDFWFIGCKPCIDELPALQRLQEKYRDQGVTVIGLEVFKNDPEQINRFVESWGIDYLQLYGPQIEETGILTCFEGYPTHFLIDREGNLVEIVKAPYITRKSENRIIELLEGEP